MDDYRFRSQQSPRNEAPMNSLVSPPRNGGTGNRMPQPVSQDPRTSLPRRFTTDSGRVPTLSNISAQRLPEPQNYPTAAEYKAQLLEKKKLDYERLMDQKRRFEAEMLKLDQQQMREEFDIAKMQEEMTLGRGGELSIPGHQSEPTTPPEYHHNATNSGFPTMFSRPNRYSTSSLVSPPGLFNRPGRSGSQLASPSSTMARSRFPFDEPLPSRSVPSSRRNSDEDEKEEALRQDPTSHRSTNALNRYSLPVTRRNLYDNIDQTNAAGFLFGDEEATMDSTSLAGLNGSEDPFSQMQSQRGNNGVSATVDMASQLSNGEGPATTGWGNISRHRQQQSLSNLGAAPMGATDALNSSSSGASMGMNGVGGRPFRHSLDLNYHRDTSGDTTPTGTMSPASSQVPATPPRLQTSFSSNDVPTVRNVPGATVPAAMNANAHAQQHFHNHNASIGRIPPGALNRHSRELSGDAQINSAQSAGSFPTIQSQLQANAPAFGPIPTSQAASQAPAVSSPAVSSPTAGAGGYPSYYGGANYNPTSPNGNGNGYNMPMLAMNMQNMNLGPYSPQNYTGYGPVYQAHANATPRDSQQRVIQQRRAQDNEAMNRFNNVSLESVRGQIFSLCKDQHGCRFLQKQLENREPEQVKMIWEETNQYVVELMTDPFGNYLCQKLLEYCNNDQRTVLIQNASTDMVRIALNQHGTRALQKMIEFVATPTHVSIIIGALHDRVVDLIQDLNGNHVIQKCLNKLSATDAEFIFTAVGNHCIDVGTHRHGCCVLQRCIDHATGNQKVWLIAKITENASQLVEDPFGNYVVQYIIDLNETSFTEPLVKQFQGQIIRLSKHKFSSNVMEKCLRCASDDSKDLMVRELLVQTQMQDTLKDQYGNYVVQTALEHATPHMKHQLVETIRPILPGVRSTPYGRRLQAKIQAYDSHSANTSGQSTPSDPTQGQIPMRGHVPGRGMGSQSSISSGTYTNGVNGINGNGGRGQMSYPHSSTLTVSNPPNAPPQPPRMATFQTYPGANMHPGGGEGQFF